MACGLWPVAFGLWPVACGLWPVANSMADRCGHAAVAKMLVDKGCGTELVSSSGKTGARLAEQVQQERSW